MIRSTRSSSALALFAHVCSLLVATSTGELFSDAGLGILDNRDTCAHRVLNCDPSVDHFETKISMDHSSSVSKLQYENTHVLLEQIWPTRGPWMKRTSQKIVFVRCGCPVPDISADWSDANIFHIPVSSVMVQMPNTLSKMYLMGQRSKVTAIESTRYLSDALPEIHSDIRDGIVNRLDLSLNGKPSTRMTLSFTGVFQDDSAGFRLQLINKMTNLMLGRTECIYPTNSTESMEHVMGKAFNSIPGWIDAGKLWILTKGDASQEPSTSLSYDVFFENQLSQDLSLRGEAESCGSDVDFKFDRSFATSRQPIYHRLHNLPGGFPDILIAEPRSLGMHADDPKIEARLFIDSDPGETTPLGRAELMKLMALMVGSVDTGNTLFGSIETRYNDAKSIAEKAISRPTVMVGKPGTWNEAARNSWMVTVDSSYVGQLFKDANVEYRNLDDAINKELCGSGCGVCPSGTSDTRCSVGINDYLDLFAESDYWISAGIGSNCWSASCNFELDSDTLLGQNPDIFSQFSPMKCGSVIALDKSHSNNGNTYWEDSHLRPDIVLMDLVTLMHPDLEIEGETTFMRILPPLANTTGVPSCPRSQLPVTPVEETVYVTSRFKISTDPSAFETIGAPYFAVLDRFYSSVNEKMAESLSVHKGDLKLAMANNLQDDFGFLVDVTVRVPNCESHSCAVGVGNKLDTIGTAFEKALDLSGISVKQDSSKSTHVLSSEGDIIPLADLVSTGQDIAESPESSSDTASTSTVAGESSNIKPDSTAPPTSRPTPTSTPRATPRPTPKPTDSDSDSASALSAASAENEGGTNDGFSTGAIAGIIVGILAALFGMFGTYKHGYAEGAKATQLARDQNEFAQEDPAAVA